MAAEMAERVGARMRERREELSLTQAEVALRIAGKATSDQVSRWERGKHQPQDLAPIAQALEVDLSYFIVPAPNKTTTPDLSKPVDTDPARLVALLERVEGLLEQQNELLARQSLILERIEGATERVDAAAHGLADTAAEAGRALRSSPRRQPRAAKAPAQKSTPGA